MVFHGYGHRLTPEQGTLFNCCHGLGRPVVGWRYQQPLLSQSSASQPPRFGSELYGSGSYWPNAMFCGAKTACVDLISGGGFRTMNAPIVTRISPGLNRRHFLLTTAGAMSVPWFLPEAWAAASAERRIRPMGPGSMDYRKLFGIQPLVA